MQIFYANFEMAHSAHNEPNYTKIPTAFHILMGDRAVPKMVFCGIFNISRKFRDAARKDVHRLYRKEASKDMLEYLERKLN